MICEHTKKKKIQSHIIVINYSLLGSEFKISGGGGGSIPIIIPLLQPDL